jgi:hypothetical protein
VTVVRWAVRDLVLLTVQLVAVTILTKRHSQQAPHICTVGSVWAAVSDGNGFVLAGLGQQATTRTEVPHKLPNTHGVLSVL